ncbi:hypothetical protein Tco_0773431 [Tanacetum coccineum]|uniref:Uncharacterized protein n=1 Tax=Tanacetum coccineum TaxID=301880 RepID=A0ABQ4ZKW3_9ASTR
MESKDMVSRSLRKDEIKLRMLRNILNNMKEDFNKNLREIKKIVEIIRPRFHISYVYNYAFEVLFGAKYDSFIDTFFQNMDRLDKQFVEEEFHEYHSKTSFTLLKKQFETFLSPKPFYSSSQTSEFERQVKIFQEYSPQKTKYFQFVLIRYLDDIERVIVDRTRRADELRIKKDVKEKREKLEMQKQEMMIQKSECNNLGDNLDAKREKQAKEKYIVQFRLLYTPLELLFGEEVEYFAPRLFFNLDKLENQLKNEEFDEEVSMVVFKVFKNLFQQFITNQIDSVEKDIVERGLHKKVHDSKVNERTMQIQVGMFNMVKDKCDVGLVVTEISRTKLEKYDESSRSRNDTQAEGADIRLSNDTNPLNEVQSTIAYNVFANDKQHAKQPKFINERKVNQDAEQCLEKRPLIASVIENKTAESLNQTLESKNDYDSSSSSIDDSQISELEKESGENICENAKCEFQTKIVELEKVLTQKTKDFDDVKLELLNRTAKFKAYFEKLENMKVVFERQLARKTDDSKAEKDKFLKEINHLRVQLENLKGKYVETKNDTPSILGKPPADKLLINSQLSKSWFTPKVVMQKDLSKPATAQYLPKNEKDQFLKQIASLLRIKEAGQSHDNSFCGQKKIP